MTRADKRQLEHDGYGNIQLVFSNADLAAMGFTKDEIERGNLWTAIEVFDDEESASGKALSIRKGTEP